MKRTQTSSYLSKRLDSLSKNSSLISETTFSDISSSLLNCCIKKANIPNVYKGPTATITSTKLQQPVKEIHRNRLLKQGYPSYALDGVKLMVDRLRMLVLKSFREFKIGTEAMTVRQQLLQQQQTYSSVHKPEVSGMANPKVVVTPPQINKKDEYIKRVFGALPKQSINISLKEWNNLKGTTGSDENAKPEPFKRSRTRTLAHHKSEYIPCKSQVQSPFRAEYESQSQTAAPNSGLQRDRTSDNLSALSSYTSQLPKPSMKSRLEQARQKLGSIRTVKDNNNSTLENILANADDCCTTTTNNMLPIFAKTISGEEMRRNGRASSYSTVSHLQTHASNKNVFLCDKQEEAEVFSMTRNDTFSNDLQTHSPKLAESTVLSPFATTAIGKIERICEAAYRRVSLVTIACALRKLQKVFVHEPRRIKMGCCLLRSALKPKLVALFKAVLHQGKRTDNMPYLGAIVIMNKLENYQKENYRKAFGRIKEVARTKKLKETLLREADAILVQMHSTHLFVEFISSKLRTALRPLMMNCHTSNKRGTITEANAYSSNHIAAFPEVNIKAEAFVGIITRILEKSKARETLRKLRERKTSSLSKKFSNLIKLRK